MTSSAPIARTRPSFAVPRHRGHLRAERLGDLHGERSHTATGTVDEHPLPCLNLAFVTQALERCQTGDRHGRGLLEGQITRLRCQPILRRDRVLAERPAPHTEHLIIWLESRHIVAYGLDDARQVPTANPRRSLLRTTTILI